MVADPPPTEVTVVAVVVVDEDVTGVDVEAWPVEVSELGPVLSMEETLEEVETVTRVVLWVDPELPAELNPEAKKKKTPPDRKRRPTSSETFTSLAVPPRSSWSVSLTLKAT